MEIWKKFGHSIYVLENTEEHAVVCGEMEDNYVMKLSDMSIYGSCENQ